MGTRSDFYVGIGVDAEWLGSYANDGYPSALAPAIATATDEAAYRTAVGVVLGARDDATLPDQGWPWPWEDSRTTDYAYTWNEGQVLCSNFGHGWHTLAEFADDADFDNVPKVVFPNMEARQKVTFGKRSGLIVVGLGGVLEDLD